MIDVTLEEGVEVLHKENIPEITNVFDAKDHSGGNNPHF